MSKNVDDLLIDVINDCYQKVLKRDCDESGIKTYLHHFKQGKSKEWLISILENSNEYKKNRKPPELRSLEKKKSTDVNLQNRTSKNIILEKKSIQDIITKREKRIISKPETNEKEIINIFMCVRDNERDIDKTLLDLKTIENELTQYSFYYYILENDSNDNTPHLIIDFFNHSNGKFKIEKNDKCKWGDTTDIDRVKDMAYYRNVMLRMCKTWDNSKFSFILDTGVTFQKNIISEYIKFMNENIEVVMATPYGTVNNTEKYYDTFALKVKNKKHGYFPYTNINSVIDVESAFGGFVCILSKYLKDVKWTCSNIKVSEHNSICEQLRNYGKVVINKKIRVQWKK